MRIVPVLDVMNGQVVRGVGGRRAEYRPIVSRLTDSAAPLAVARAFRERFGLTHFYLADLDAIAGAAPTLPTYADLHADGFSLWVDAGIRRATDAVPLARAGIDGIVAGLETLGGPQILRELCEMEKSSNILFSLDLKGGAPLASGSAWPADPWAIATEAIACGVRRLIVLDLARVGVAAGTGTEELCGRLATTYPSVEVIAGGGIRDFADLQRLRSYGVGAALVASALHDGRLTRTDLEGL
ncbi:MAG TPA: HisA/HisF-related TIM barrel protein [Gemmataceae bacterium]|nr:HisA/HisF-related TIM barrel protein [Gemmataceae bacterium]